MPKYFSTGLTSPMNIQGATVGGATPIALPRSSGETEDTKKKKKKEGSEDHMGEEGHNSNGAYDGLTFGEGS